jgi:hypothetical protein
VLIKNVRSVEDMTSPWPSFFLQQIDSRNCTFIGTAHVQTRKRTVKKLPKGHQKIKAGAIR